jgi:type I restriction enzyme S subunit
VWTTVDACADIITGNTPSKKDPSNYGDFLPLVKPPELTDGTVDDAPDKLSENGAKLARILPPESVLVSCIGILGKTGINSVPVAFNQQINAAVFPSGISSRYGLYYFQSSEAKAWLNSVASATTVTIVNKSKFQRTPFPLAPICEQHRIVAEIETQFTRLEAGVAALKRAQAKLRRYKAAVLKAACEGRLVPTEAELARAEGRDYEPADVLLQRILAERRAKWEAENPGKKYKEPALPDTSDLPELPEGWVWASADELTSRITDGERITPERAETGVLLLSARNIQNGHLSLEKVDFVPERVYRVLSRRLLIEPGDVLMSCSGTVGRSCVAPENLRFALVRSVAVLKPLARMGSFLSYAIRSPLLQFQIDEKKTQTAQANIFQGKIKTLIFLLPPLAEQHRVVAEVERRLSVVAELDKQVEAALRRADRLRQAILKHAFAGKLVPQDPDDGPASVLLERIQAQRIAARGRGRVSGPRLEPVNHGYQSCRRAVITPLEGKPSSEAGMSRSIGP